MPRKTVFALLAVLVAGLLASCGGGGASDEEAGASDTTSVTTTTTEATESVSFDCEVATGKPNAVIAAIPINGGYEYGWSEKSLKFKAGDEVILKLDNKSDTYHDFAADACFPGRFEKGQSLTISFTMPDAPVDFLCSIHPQTMMGTLVPE
jgi:uncharacterized cupredoxin-like copper-binding protein